LNTVLIEKIDKQELLAFLSPSGRKTVLSHLKVYMTDTILFAYGTDCMRLPGMTWQSKERMDIVGFSQSFCHLKM